MMIVDDEDFDWEDDDDFSWDSEEEEEEAEEDFSFIPEDDAETPITKTTTTQPATSVTGMVTYVETRLEKRPARLDITKNSEEDHRHLNRYTKKDLEEQVKKDYRYMRGKGYMMIQPFLILDEYPFKVKSSDSDVIRKDGKNVEEDIVLVIGRLPKLKGTEEFKRKPYIRGEIMFIRPGHYDIGLLKPHFALVIKKKYKVIKQAKIRIRDLFDIVKNELQNGKPFIVYKEFPKFIG